jgi:hypothetical protein
VPILGHLDEPRPSRWPGVLIGMAIAIPLVGLFVGWLVPSFVGAVLGGAQSLDERLRLEDGYMTALCSSAMDVERDETLCECVLAVEFPALDCQAPFLAWSVDRQLEHCADPTAHEASLAFCSCVEQVAQNVAEASDEAESERHAQAYRRCQDLPDAVFLPTIDALVGS